MTDNPQSLIVCDLETIRADGLAQTLGLGEKIEELAKIDDDDLRDFGEALEIKLGNLKDAEKIRAKIEKHFEDIVKKAALKPYGCQVKAIGMMGINGKTPHVAVATDEVSESDIITSFLCTLEVNAPHVLCGFNIRDFDIPVLRSRCLILDIHWPSWLPRSRREDKYDNRVIFDIRDVLDEGPLDTWLRVFGLPPKTGRGDKVQNMTVEEVAAYCGDDVYREAMLARRIIPSTKFSEYML